MDTIKYYVSLPISYHFSYNWIEYRKGSEIAHSVIAMPGSSVPINQPKTITVTAAAPATAIEDGPEQRSSDSSKKQELCDGIQYLFSIY